MRQRNIWIRGKSQSVDCRLRGLRTIPTFPITDSFPWCWRAGNENAHAVDDFQTRSKVMSCRRTGTCDCGCCSGTSVQTPQVGTNRPGLPSISYRVGRWATFKESMLARLSSSDYPALTALKTRDDDDFTIAFLDATSVVFDVLTFYLERLANESYLRTAGQLRSLIEMSRLIGYQPAPGVAAECYVAFTLKTAPGQTPDPSAPALTIPQRTHRH